MRILINIILSVIFLVYNYFPAFAYLDSLENNSNIIKSSDSLSLMKNDTLRLFEPLAIHGSISNNKFTPYFQITKDSILLSDYTTLSDIFSDKLLTYPLLLGNYSNLNSFSLFSGFPNGLSFRFNGRSIGDFQFPMFNFETFPVEYLENIEIYTGSDAVIFSDNSSTALINFQEKKYNTKKPYTKIWFSQAAYDFLASDGIFSQNFMPNFNFTFGFRRMSVKGRFDNTWMDSWNLRGGLRWNINEKINISLVEIFTNHGQGTNGGIDKQNTQDIFDELIANSKYNQLDERAFKHDLTITLTSILGALDESEKRVSTSKNEKVYDTVNKSFTNVFSSSIFFSHSEWNQKRQSELFYLENDSAVFTKNVSVYTGLNSSLDFSINNWLNLKTGVEITFLTLDKSVYYSAVEDFRWSIFGHFLSNPFSENIKISGGIRTGFIYDYYYLNVGSKVLFDINNHSNFYLDLSKFDRIPSPSEGFHLSKETGVIILAGLNIKNDYFELSSNAFYRNLKSPVFAKPLFRVNFIQDLIFNNEDDLTSYGLSFSLNFTPIKNINARFNLIAQKFFLNGNEINLVPLLYPTIDSYYEILRGKSYIRLGMNASLITPNKAMTFNPFRRSYIYSDYLTENEQEDSPLFFDGVNIYAKARLGSVYVKISLQNVLSTNYFYIKYYPMFDRNLRISLLWAFDD